MTRSHLDSISKGAITLRELYETIGNLLEDDKKRHYEGDNTWGNAPVLIRHGRIEESAIEALWGANLDEEGSCKAFMIRTKIECDDCDAKGKCKNNRCVKEELK